MSNISGAFHKFRLASLKIFLPIDHFKIAYSVTWLLNSSEAAADLVLIKTSLHCFHRPGNLSVKTLDLQSASGCGFHFEESIHRYPLKEYNWFWCRLIVNVWNKRCVISLVLVLRLPLALSFLLNSSFNIPIGRGREYRASRTNRTHGKQLVFYNDVYFLCLG